MPVRAEPLVGTEVRSDRFAGSDWVGTMTLKVKTDAAGPIPLIRHAQGQGELPDRRPQ